MIIYAILRGVTGTQPREVFALPSLEGRLVLRITRTIKAFLNLEAGVGRSEPGARDRAPDRVRREGGGIRPENIVWIFGHGRSGTTWLMRMMRENPSYLSWGEPWVGALFGIPYYRDSLEAQRRRRDFIMGSRQEVWLAQIRSFVLGAADATFPGASEGNTLVIKETDGSIGAPLLMKALPESRMVFLIRDPRDVVASRVDASGEGGWNEEVLGKDRPVFTAEQWATFYLTHISNAREAYEAHEGRKVLVRYEDMLSDTLGTLRRIHSALELEADEKTLARTVEKNAWKNIPDENKGRGKFYRKADPGSWREDLTPEQVETVESITASILNEYYAG